MSGPTTMAPSAVLQVMHTLTTVTPLGAFARDGSTNVKSAGSRSAFSRSIIGSYQAASGRELCWVAPTAYAPSGSLPSGAPHPDDASKAHFVMAGILARRSLPDPPLPRKFPIAPPRALLFP